MCAICRKIRSGEAYETHDLVHFAFKDSSVGTMSLHRDKNVDEVYIVAGVSDANNLTNVPLYITHCPFCGEEFFKEDTE